MGMTTVHLEYPVGANRLWKMARGRMVLSAEARSWKEAAAWEASRIFDRPMAGNVGVTIIMHPRTNKDGSASQTRLDLDGCIKPTLDALNGVAYIDDKQVNRLFVVLGDPCEGGGLTVTIKPGLPYPALMEGGLADMF